MVSSSSTHSQSPFDLPGYTYIATLYEGSRAVIYRAVNNVTQQLVIVKKLRQDCSSASDFLRLRHQYTITQHLAIAGIVKPLGLEPCGNSYALVMEDLGSISLQNYAQQVSLELTEVLRIGLQLADILHNLHLHRVIHQDIKPTNILIHPESKQIHLNDFSIAALLPQATQVIRNPNAIEGTPAYLAPEQTGRMNRSIDHRTDFYGLGITLYQLLTGDLPFQSNDALELLHCHIAKVATPVHQVMPTVPEKVSAIVAKLMAKNAEDRYQSALGLKHDLETCLTQWERNATIADFKLGQRDMCDRFLIADKLYGRDTEVETLQAAFERVTEGASEMLMVTGVSGVGKTALVNQLYKPIPQQRGYFIQGKFDQFNQSSPFSALMQAFRGLVRQLLSEPDETLAAWKSKILKALGINGQVILNVIPELKHIIGEQPPAPQLSGTAAQNRFNLVLEKFVRVFATQEHPLVIFLDDLHWADAASLNLLELLIDRTQAAHTTELENGLSYQQHSTEVRKGYLLIIGAYRENEIRPQDPLALTLHAMAQQNIAIRTCTLKSLSQSDINQLVADTLRCRPHITEPLAQLVYQKAQGNPFLTIQFLSELQNNEYITFNAQQGHWQCDLAQIQQLAVTTTGVDYMVERLQTLPLPTQNALTIAACIGNHFDLSTLTAVSDMSQEQSSFNLWQALQAGLIIPEGNTYQFSHGNKQWTGTDLSDLTLHYRFLHDRVQQAAYQLIPEDKIQQVHLKIGNHWLNKAPIECQHGRPFGTINQLNLGCQLITNQTERHTLLQLNRQAAKQAIDTTAYDTARAFLDICFELLLPNSWQNDYALTLDIHNLAVENAYFQGNWEAIETFALAIEQHAQNTLDIVKAYEFKIEARTVQGKFLEATYLGLKLLALFGIEFPEHPNNENFKVSLRKTQRLLAGRSAAEISNSPRVTSLQTQSVLRLLAKIGTAAYNLSTNLYALIGLTMLQISLVEGNLPESTLGYLRYGILNCGLLEDIETGYSFGRAALKLIEQFETSGHTANTIWVAYSFIVPHKEPIKETLAPLKQAYTLGLETGELACAGYAAYAYCAHGYLAGQELTALNLEIERYSQGMAAINQTAALGYTQMLHQAVLNLSDIAPNSIKLDGNIFNETEMLPRFEQTQDKLSFLCFYIHKLMLCYLFQAYDKALNYQQKLQPLLKIGIGSINTSPIFFFGTLTCLILLRQKLQPLDMDVAELEQTITLGKEKLNFWASHNPHYYQHKYDLVCAEDYLLNNDRLAALEAYDRAIVGAKEHGYLQDEALANELAAQFYLDWGKRKIAAIYLQDAYVCYLKWGAKAKTNDLAQRYPQLLKPFLLSSEMVINPLETLSDIVSLKVSSYSSRVSNSIPKSINQTFDFGAILKAAQTLTETLQLDELLHNLSQIILKNSGGDRLILVLPNTQGNWEVRVLATSEAINVDRYPLDDNPDVPIQLIHYVKNTRELLYTDQLEADFPVIDDYLLTQRPKSFLCAPLVTQNELFGILYLHSSVTHGLISSDRIVTLNFLFSQIAIGLKNARIFKDSLALKSKIIESSIDGIAILEDGKYIYLNSAHNILFGYEEGELLGERWEKLYPEEELQRLFQVSLTRLKQDGQWSGEGLGLRKDGSTFYHERSVFHLDDGKLICVCRDISDRKQAEQQLKRLSERLELAIESAQIGIWEWDHQQNRLVWDDNMHEIYGVNPEAFEGTYESWANRVHPEDLAEAEAQKARITENGAKRYTQEFQIVRPDGTMRHILAAASIERDSQGKPIRSVGMNLDITERKATELALQESEDRFRRITANMPGMIYRCVLHPDGTDVMTYVSSKVREIFELEPDNVCKDGGRQMWERTHPDDIGSIEADMQSSIETLQPFNNEHRLILPQKGLRWIQANAQPTCLENGDIVWDGVVIDITDRKHLEQEQERLIQILQATTDFIGICQPSKGILWQNEPFRKLRPDLNIFEEEVEISGLYPQWAYEIVRDEGLPTASRDGTWSGETALLTQFGEEIPTSQVIIAHKSNSGEVEYFSTILRDISALKATEQALHDSQAQIQHMTKNVPGMIYRYILHPNGNQELSYVSPQVQEIYELSSKAVLEDISRLQERIHPDDHSYISMICQESAEKLQPFKLEHRLVLPTKGLRWIQAIARPERLDNGDIVWDGLALDISDRKQAETILQEEQLRLKLALDAAKMGTWSCIMPTGELIWSERTQEIFGFEPGKSPENYDTFVAMIHPEDRTRVMETTNNTVETGIPYQIEYRIRRLDGKIRWVAVWGRALFHIASNPRQLVGVVIDVSDRKAAEQELILKQNHLEALLNNIPHIAWIKDSNSRFIAVNEPLAQMLDCSSAEMINKTDYDFSPAAIARSYQEDDLQVLTSGQRKVVEERVRRGDGSWGWLETTKTPFRDAQGQLAGTVGIAVDITDRKQIEGLLTDYNCELERQVKERTRDLQASQHELTGYIENAATLLHWVDQNGIILWANQTELAFLGYDREDYIGQPIAKFHADQRVAADILTHFSNSKDLVNYEARLCCKDGSIRTVQINSNVFYRHGEFIHIRCFTSDITERKAAEMALNDLVAGTADTTGEDFFPALVRHISVALNASHAFVKEVTDDGQCRILAAWGDGQYLPTNDLIEPPGTPCEIVLEEGAYHCNSAITSHFPTQSKLSSMAVESYQGVALFDRQGRKIGLLCVFSRQPMADSERSEQILRVFASRAATELERQRAEMVIKQQFAAIEAAIDGISILQNGVYLYVNQAHLKLFGYDHAKELVGKSWKLLYSPDEVRRFEQEILPELTHSQGWQGEALATRKDGSDFTQGVSLTLTEEGLLISVCRDISELKQAQALITHNALHDPLTSLPNRTLLLERLTLAMQRAQRQRNYRYAVLFLDLDRFKVINDSLGHVVGDQLLVTISKRLKTHLRQTDLVARLGGDEFLVLLEDISSAEEVAQIAERILADCQTPITLNNHQIFTSISIGIVLGKTDDQQAVDLIRDADIAMYQAKTNGRNSYRFFDTTMHTEALKRLTLETDLRKAVDKQEFTIHYQPIIELSNRQLIGFEALVRWQHSTQGLINPDEFIPIAEETGCIELIDSWILHQACHQVANWQKQFPKFSSLKISINLSAHDLGKADLIQGIDEVLKNTGLEGNSITLEITESLLIKDIEQIIELFMQLTARQIQISVDDFGTGYSSLSYLHRLPVHSLKIDRSFVGQMELSNRNYKVVNTIISLGQQLGLNTIAEGIETQQQLQLLQQLGCQFGQGYLVAKPLSAQEVETYLLQGTDLSVL